MHALMLLTKNVERDPRVIKELETLEQAGIRVTLIFLDRESDRPPAKQQETAGTHAIRIGRIRSGAPSSVAPALLRYYSRATTLARRIHRKTPFYVVHCHDLDSMPAGLLLSRLWRLPLIYDIHDLYSSYFKGRVMRSITQRIDRVFYGRADRMVITHDSFEREISGRTPSVILMNVPKSKGSGSVRDKATGLFYAGNLDWIRDMRWAVPALTGSGIKVTFAGVGPLLEDYRNVQTPGALDLLGWISAEAVERCTRACFAVLALYDPRIPNNRLLAPNKLFDAMKFGKPAIVSDNTTMAEIVRDFDCGVTVRYGDIDSLRAALRRLQDGATYRKLAQNAYAAFSQEFNWEVMEDRLLSMYRELGGLRSVNTTPDVVSPGKSCGGLR